MYLRAASYPLSLLRFLAVCAVLLIGTVEKGYGQGPMERVYANSQTNNLTPPVNFVTNPSHAVDEVPSTHSTIGVTLLGNVWQQLRFPTTLSSGTPTRVKIGTSGNILGLLGSIRIQAYNNNSSIGTSVQLNSLISLIAGEDQAEIVFTPSAPFNAVRISSSGISLGDGLKIYEAYYLKPSIVDISCDSPADILYGSTSTLAGGLNTVTNPRFAIDGDLNSYAAIRATAGVANETHLTALYNTNSHASDSIRIVLRRPGGLLDVNLLSDIVSISTMLDGVDNGEIDYSSEFLSLRLLPGHSDIQEITYPLNSEFNRIKVSINGLVDVLTSLDVFEIQRIMAKPIITSPRLENNEITLCEDESVTFVVQDVINDSEYHWYDVAFGGSPIKTGPEYTFIPSANGTVKLYASRSRPGCIEESARVEITIHVLPQPGKPHLSITGVQN